MEADIVITGVSLTPNPVQTGKTYIISVEIKEKVHVLGENTYKLSDGDGALISVTD